MEEGIISNLRDSEEFKQFVKNYWKYYRELEDEFLQTRRYVEVCTDNKKTYSIEYLKLFQAVCSEIDVVGKMMAKYANGSFKPEDTSNNILKWWFEIQEEYFLVDGPFTNMNRTKDSIRYSLTEYRCVFLDELEIHPWKNYHTEKYFDKKGRLRFRVSKNAVLPNWWASYNKVKHNRTSLTGDGTNAINYSRANLNNLSNAFGALYILERAFIDTVGEKDDLLSFMDFSELFVKPRRYTFKETEAILGTIISEEDSIGD